MSSTDSSTLQSCITIYTAITQPIGYLGRGADLQREWNRFNVNREMQELHIGSSQFFNQWSVGHHP